MKKLLEYLPFHFTLSLIIGITSQFNFRIWSFGFSRIVYTIFFLFLLLVLLRKSKLFFLSVWVFFFYIGVIAVYIQNDTNYQSYYENHYNEKSTTILVIEKVLKPGIFYHKYEASIIQVDSVQTRGSVLLNIERDSIELLKVDDFLLLRAKLNKLMPPLNPHQFNYKSYLKKQGIQHQIFIRKGDYIIEKERNRFSFSGFAFKVRSVVQESLQKYSFKKEELAIINALLLGQRQDISKELINNYANAGAIHILAVSGLHVGIILLILSYLLKPIERFKKGKLYKTTLIIVLLWMFALVAGLSASVVRAVTMFTFVAIGIAINRKNSIIHSLIASAFFLLLIHPLFLFYVGFQLSYLAVFGIVWMQPKLAQLWKPKYKLTNKFWQLITVSIAAQFGILPLSLYYFHQFPGLFILSNLVIIPFLGSILIGGILVIILALAGILPSFLVTLYGYTISTMNNFIHFVSAQEKFLITDISFSAFLMVSSYFLLFSIGLLFSRKNFRTIIVFLTSVIVFQGVFLFEKYTRQQEETLIVFHKSRNTILGLRQLDSLQVYHDLPSNNIISSSILQSYKVGENVLVTYEDRISNFFQIGDQTVLIIDEKAIYHFENYKQSIIILRQSPKVNLERLIETLRPKLIIADGSNYKNVVLQWKQTSVKNKIPFWYTGKNGAYEIKG